MESIHLGLPSSPSRRPTSMDNLVASTTPGNPATSQRALQGTHVGLGVEARLGGRQYILRQETRSRGSKGTEQEG